ncbi:MAG TPA: xanthine dehydrogenase family protein molybdopterin-binding subunit [Candidatus Dormibacteraeota bacterium]|nr:xanthine dehydrogenase family protein molybdopterin-binding subunit [Candidatus Dormibacteraeota bacterium]
MSTTVETWVGRSIPCREDAPLVTGTGTYVADLDLPGTLEVAFVRSPLAHARIKRLDPTPALASPGVVAVFTGPAIRDRVRPLVLEQEAAPPGLEVAEPEIRPATIEILADGEVRYVGQPVAAVVADSRYHAEDGADLVVVEYEELPAAIDPEKAKLPGAPIVYDNVPGNVQARYRIRVGDVEAAFAAAEHRLTLRVRTQRVAASPMETRGVLASCVGEQITLWSSTQIPHIVRNSVADAIGAAQWQVRVLIPHVGGGFGCKVQVYPEEVLLAHIARELRRPVRWIEDRQEHLVATAHARDQLHRVEAAFDGEGHVIAVRDAFVLDSGVACPYPLSSAYNVASHFRSMYRIPNFTVDGECVLTHKMFNLPYRGAGRPEAAFVMDRVINEVARRLGLDPVEVVRRNLITDAEQPYDMGMPYRDGKPVVYDATGFPEAFEKAVELVGYEEHRRTRDRLRDRGVWRGIGFGTYVEGTGVGPFESAEVQLDAQGRVVVSSGCAPHGQGLETTMSQVVADAFGMRPEEIVFRAGDTALVPYGVGTFASRSAITAGAAIVESAERLKRRIRAIAGELLETAPEDLEISAGEVRVKGVASRRVSLRDVYRAALPGPGARLPEGMDPGSAEICYWVPPTVTWGYGVVAAVVEVDVETGVVEVKKLVVVHDCGRVINPLIVEGQLDGGLVQGMGATLYEHVVYGEDGQPRATTFMDYLLPTAAEVPEIVQVHTESFSERNPLGVKGVGEAGTIAPPAAIANAIADAVAPLPVQLNELPLSPAAVLAALEAASDRPSTGG